MPRYIDADEFVKRVIQYPRQSTKTIGLALADTPTADVQEVKHGRWIFWNKNRVLCSVCKLEPYAGKGADSFKYCPYCGAKMDGKETEN